MVSEWADVLGNRVVVTGEGISTIVLTDTKDFVNQWSGCFGNSSTEQ